MARIARLSVIAALVVAVSSSFVSAQQQDAKQKQKQAKAAPPSGETKPAPDLANVVYGPHERNVFNLWKAKRDTPTPPVVYIHGGGFQANSKESVSAQLLKACLDSGISVAATNYRLSLEFQFPTHYMDSASSPVGRMP